MLDNLAQLYGATRRRLTDYHDCGPHCPPPSGRLYRPANTLYDENFRFILDLAIPGIAYDHPSPLGTLTVRHPDGSTAQIGPTGQAQQHGPRRLCDEITAIHDMWRKAGNPRPDRYRLTLGPQDHTVWLDDRSGTHYWTL